MFFLFNQGEELALTDVYISWNNTKDPQACRTNPNDFHAVSRDPARTPFQWDDTKNAGKKGQIISIVFAFSYDIFQGSAVRMKLGYQLHQITLSTMSNCNNRNKTVT